MFTRIVFYAISASLLTGCASQVRLGEGASPVQGSAGAAGARSSNLAACTTPIGTAALIEPDARVSSLLSRVGLGSPLPLLRLMMQQSNCFQVVDRGAAMASLEQEDRLARDGMLDRNSQTARGRMVAVQYLITPEIVFSEPNAGGAGAGGIAGGRLGALGAIVGAVAGSMKVQEAQVVLFVTDAGTGIQVAAIEGSAKVRDFGGMAGLGAFGAGLAGFGAIGGYSRTNEGKLISAALLDAFNGLVPQVAAMTPAAAPRAVAPAAVIPEAPAPAAAPARGIPPFTPGASYTPAVTINVRGGPGTEAPVVGKVAPGHLVVAVGDRRNNWWFTWNSSVEGWVLATNLRAAGH